MRINICISADENYAEYLCVAMASVLKNANDSDELHFYILDGGINKYQKQCICNLNKIKSFDIKFFNLVDSVYTKFPPMGHITSSSYFRYAMGELFSDIDKIIYIDCDVLVVSSLAELYTINIDDYYMAGVEDVGYVCHRKTEPKFRYKDIPYINSGVLLANLDLWRKNNLKDALIKYTFENADSLACVDQDVINAVCHNKILQIDYKWNVQDSFYRYDDEPADNINKDKIIEASRKPVIIHFTGPRKPWNYKLEAHPKAQLYLKYLKLTDFKDSYKQLALKAFMRFLAYAFINPSIAKKNVASFF